MPSTALRERSKFHPETANVRVIPSKGQGLETKQKIHDASAVLVQWDHKPWPWLLAILRSITFPGIDFDSSSRPLGMS